LLQVEVHIHSEIIIYTCENVNSPPHFFRIASELWRSFDFPESILRKKLAGDLGLFQALADYRNAIEAATYYAYSKKCGASSRFRTCR